MIKKIIKILGFQKQHKLMIDSNFMCKVKHSTIQLRLIIWIKLIKELIKE
jgi:hypothetical protein